MSGRGSSDKGDGAETQNGTQVYQADREISGDIHRPHSDVVVGHIWHEHGDGVFIRGLPVPVVDLLSALLRGPPRDGSLLWSSERCFEGYPILLGGRLFSFRRLRQSTYVQSAAPRANQIQIVEDRPSPFDVDLLAADADAPEPKKKKRRLSSAAQ